jgi:GNAT superfamily N-acetyltransferase
MVDGTVVGAFGLIREREDRWSLRWILLAPAVQGRGIGSAIMQEVRQRLVTARGRLLTIAASHKSAPFFARFGAREVARTAHGWGPEMHRVDMELVIAPRSS